VSQARVNRKGRKRLKEKVRQITARTSEIKEENKALQMALALQDVRVIENGMNQRWVRGVLQDVPVGTIKVPIPKGWTFDGTRGVSSRNNQMYVELNLIKVEPIGGETCQEG